ncbi:MAG TPA: DUF4168 domain-containing protein [Reyranella sp.]|jgi:glucose/arabinose dehydrogenase
MQSTTGFCAMALTAAGLLFMPAAQAQDKAPATPSPTAPAPTPTNITDSKLDAAAAAVKRVSSIQGAYEQKLAKAPDADKQRVAGEANEAMTKAVTDQGLSIEEYTTIMTVAQKDPVVRNKLLQRLK